MRTASFERLGETLVPLLPGQLPYEIWRPIFQLVYASKTCISHPPSDFVWSPLNSRLNIYRNLALVSRSWRANVREVFFEELQAHTAESLKGITKTFQNQPSLALAVLRISFSFWEFRCSASHPRRPRPLRPDAELDVEDLLLWGDYGSSATSSARRTPDWKTIHRRDARAYGPSTTSQGSHWMRWQADVGHILAMCTSLSEVDITFTDDRRTSHSWVQPPDMTNRNILSGLLQSTNLRKLILIDPTPLEYYGPALTSWSRLGDLSITLTRASEEFAKAAFCPPKSLTSFQFHDRSNGNIPWPLASDLARCTNLQVLDLAVTSLAHKQTAKAIGFLIQAYQLSLRELTLDVLPRYRSQEDSVSARDVLASLSPLHFPKLERLCLPHASCDTSILAEFRADGLTYVELGWLTLEPFAGSREDKWSQGFSRRRFTALKHLVIRTIDPDQLRKQALYAVCERLGIRLTMGPKDLEDAEEERVDIPPL